MTQKSIRFFVLACCLPAIFSSPIHAGVFSDCSPCEAVVCDPCEPVCGNKESLWNFGGWIEAGIMANHHGQKDAYIDGVLDPNSGNTGHLKNVKHASFQMNQLWFYGEKKRNRRGLDIGGRVEFMYGVDGRHFQAFGLDRSNSTGKRWGDGDYYASLPQMYAEVGYKNLGVKVGKFFTVMGLDSSCAPNRFFYSTSYENQTYIDFGGVLATWDVNKNLSVFGGWVNGEERFFTDGDHNAFLGGVNWTVGPWLKLDYSVLIGKDDSVYDVQREYFVSSLVARLKLNGRWGYAVAWLLRNEKNETVPGDHWGRYGINQELFYKVNKYWTLGFGAEWLRHYEHGTDYDVYSFRIGANWKPNARFTLRPEIRYDKCDGLRPFNISKSGGVEPKDGQFLYGFSGIITF